MEQSAARTTSPDQATGSSRILVVDDHDLNRKLLERVLELDGRQVRTVDSLSAADQAIAEEQPAMIVLDLNLPDGDGLELTRKLRSNPETAGIPILACTAGVMRIDEERALEAGCDAFVSKPLDMPRFSMLVASLLP